VKQLSRRNFSPAQKQNHAEHDGIEKKFHLRRRPARDTVGVVDREPICAANFAEAAAVDHAADATEHDADRNDEGEPVAGDAVVFEQPLGDFHADITAEQRASDGFAGGEDHPAVRVVPVQPAFRAEIDELRANESGDERGDVNEHEPFITPRQPRPENDAHENSREHQPAVGGGI